MSRKRIISTLLLVLSVLSAWYLSAADDDGPFRFAVIGDTGCGCDGQEEVAERLISFQREKPFDHVLMLGDNIYSGRGKRGGSRELFEGRFDDYYKPLLKQGVKFYAVLGNHDYETRDGRDEIMDKERFHILGSRGYYSFSPDREVTSGLTKTPLVTFFALNSVTLADDDEPETAQVTWLSKTLAESKSVWNIAFFHHPIYTPPGGHDYDATVLQRVENVLVAGGIRVTFTGHNHFYARIKPQRDVVHFVSGGGGRRLKTPRKDNRTALSARAYHFIYIELHADRMEFWTIPASGPPIDHGTIALKPAA